MNGLGRAFSGMRAARALLDVAGENIANQNTPGYHRKRATLAAVPGSSSVGLNIGGGAEVESIERMRDELTERAFIANSQVRASVDQTVKILDKLESTFQEPSDTGLDARMGNLFENVRRLAADPTSASLRRSVVQTGQSVTASFNRLDSEMTELNGHLREGLADRAREISGLCDRVARLNEKILHMEAGGADQTALYDRRDQAVNELANLVNIQTHTTKEGHMNIGVAGTLLVSGSDSHEVEFGVQDDVARMVSQGRTLDVREGESGGLMRLHNATLPKYHEQLDTLANSLRRSFNRLHTTGLGKDGRLKRINGANAFQKDVPLSEYGYDIPAVTDGRLIVNVQNESSGEVTQHEITGLDTTQGAKSLVQQVGGELDSLPHLTAGEDGGRLVAEADDGWSFGFATPYDPNPPTTFSAASPPEVSVAGAYDGSQDLEYSVSFLDTGAVGTDQIDVEVQVHEEGGTLVRSFNRTLEADWKDTDVLHLDHGLSLGITAGDVVSGESASFTARSSMDPQGLLDPLGVNTMFDGVGAGQVHVNESLAADPGKLSGSLREMEGDNQRFLDMVELEDQAVVQNSDLHGLYRDLVSDVATTRNNQQAQLTNLENIAQGLRDARDSASGVSVEEEMMQIFQSRRIYQGLTKYIKSLDSAYGDLFRIL